MPSAEHISRFRADWEALAGDVPEALGIAVSGGPDSLALLLLASAAFPSRIRAATVDHGLRPESATEAAFVAEVCARLAVPHDLLALDWPDPPGANLQARAREARYAALASWAKGKGVRHIATAHHLDDQAETLLMRLARGAGPGGLAGVRAATELAGVTLLRPLLGWRKAELTSIVRQAGLSPVDDPSNRDERFDRTAARALISETHWLAPDRIAGAAANLAEADDALRWATECLWAERAARDGEAILINASGLPRELQRRLLQKALSHFTDAAGLPGPKLARLLDALRADRSGTLAGVRAMPGERWRLAAAPPRRKL